MPALRRSGSQRCRSTLASGTRTAVSTTYRVAASPDRLGGFDCRDASTSIPLRRAAGIRRCNPGAQLARFRDAAASLGRSSQVRLQLAQPDRMRAMSDQSASQANGAERHLPAEIDGNSLARSAFRRGARLASLPLGFAGRATLGLGKRLGGAPAEEVSEQLQQRAAEQVFRVLGELKGGAMKFGQALSLFESVLPEEVAAPYRAHLIRLQDSAPPMPASRVHAVLSRELGTDWRKSFRSLDALPAAAASIGQVHRGVWIDGRDVAVKVQYPGADDALRSDLRQIGRLSKIIAPIAGGMDVAPLAAELAERVSEELDYTLEAASQQQAATGFRGHSEFVVPAVVTATRKVMISEWVDGTPLSSVGAWREAERNAAAL